MSKIPSMIPTIVFVGNTNVGKSTLINNFTNQEISIVSNIPGTTTDEVIKRMELLDIGPINLIDTAGLNDESELGKQRLNKTNKAIKRASLIVYVVDSTNYDLDYYNKLKEEKILVFNKTDLLTSDELITLMEKYKSAIFVNENDIQSIEELKERIANKLNIIERGLLDNIDLKYNKIVHVIPIDSEAPKGRIILPQMQLIRECLDRNIVSIVISENELKEVLDENNDIGLIVTDSQAFKIVSEINRKRFPLTSYSILQANEKGDLKYFIDSLDMLSKLDGPKILLMESCSHNASHDDIGRVKIPRMLNDLFKEFSFDFKMSHDFPDNLKDYQMIIHCGSCMLSPEIMQKRIKKAKELDIPMTNYGLFMAYYNNILDEATQVFKKQLK